MCFSSITINKQIAFNCDLVDVYRTMFVAFCFLTMLGTRVMVTKGNVSHTKSKRGKSVSKSRKSWDMWWQRGQDSSFRSCFGIFLSAFPGMTVTENRPNRAYSVYILQPLLWGMGQEEEREGSKG